jgi:hypothetical protein
MMGWDAHTYEIGHRKHYQRLTVHTFFILSSMGMGDPGNTITHSVAGPADKHVLELHFTFGIYL